MKRVLIGLVLVLMCLGIYGDKVITEEQVDAGIYFYHVTMVALKNGEKLSYHITEASYIVLDTYEKYKAGVVSQEEFEATMKGFAVIVYNVNRLYSEYIENIKILLDSYIPLLLPLTESERS